MTRPPPLRLGRGPTRRHARRERGQLQRARLFALRAMARLDGPPSPAEAWRRWVWVRERGAVLARYR